MFQRLSLVTAVLLGLHGLIHLMGFAAYWPLAKLPDLAYKTILLGGHWEVGAQGMQIDALLWLVAGIGFIAASIALVTRWKGWRSALLVVTLFSLVVTSLDWDSAYLGIIMNVIILIILLMRPQLSKLAIRFGG